MLFKEIVDRQRDGRPDDNDRRTIAHKGCHDAYVSDQFLLYGLSLYIILVFVYYREPSSWF